MCEIKMLKGIMVLCYIRNTGFGCDGTFGRQFKVVLIRLQRDPEVFLLDLHVIQAFYESHR